MSVYAGSKIVTTQLIYAYDMKNTQKSWKGMPTTNVISSSDTMAGWTNYYRTTASSTFTTEMGTTGYRFFYQPSWNGIYKSITLPSTGTYTFSAWYRYWGGSTNNNGATVYVSGWGGGDSATSINKNLVGTWQRISLTLNCTSTSMTYYIISYGGSDTGTTSPDWSTWEVTMPQVESGSVMSSYTSGTRSSTQAVLDMSPYNTTITTNSLTYNSDGTFSWTSGVNASLTSPSSSNYAFGVGDFTLECWINPVNFSGYTHMIALPDQNTFALKANTGDGAIYFYSPSFTTYPTTGWTLVASTWNHVVLTRVSGVAYCYLNGQLKGSKSGFSGSFSAQSLSIGNGYSGEYTGKTISSVRIYSYGLSASEIQQNFNATRSLFGV